jgi:hypothetical protein
MCKGESVAVEWFLCLAFYLSSSSIFWLYCFSFSVLLAVSGESFVTEKPTEITAGAYVPPLPPYEIISLDIM